MKLNISKFGLKKLDLNFLEYFISFFENHLYHSPYIRNIISDIFFLYYAIFVIIINKEN